MRELVRKTMLEKEIDKMIRLDKIMDLVSQIRFRRYDKR